MFTLYSGLLTGMKECDGVSVECVIFAKKVCLNCCTPSQDESKHDFFTADREATYSKPCCNWTGIELVNIGVMFTGVEMANINCIIYKGLKIYNGRTS